MHAVGTISWSMGSLQCPAFLQKTDSLPPSTQEVISDFLANISPAALPSMLGWSTLVMPGFCVCCHSHCDSVCATALSSLENNVSFKSSKKILRIFCLCSSGRLGCEFSSFCCFIFIWFCYQGSIASVQRFWQPAFFVYFHGTVWVVLMLVLWSSGEFFCKPIWSWAFLNWESFNYCQFCCWLWNCVN